MQDLTAEIILPLHTIAWSSKKENLFMTARWILKTSSMYGREGAITEEQLDVSQVPGSWAVEICPDSYGYSDSYCSWEVISHVKVTLPVWL